MEIESQPVDLASAYRQQTVVFGDVNPEVVTEISVYGGRNYALLGRKRFKGSADIEMNISPYVSRCLAPRPYYSTQTRFSQPEGRNVAAYVEWDDDNTQPMHFTSSLSNHSRLDILRTSALPRQIARHEWDEMSFAVGDNDTLVASITLRDGLSTVVPIIQTACAAGIYTLLINVDHLIASSPRSNAVTGFDLRFGVSNIFIGSASYELTPQRQNTMRLCWLNNKGGYDYHTFNILHQEMKNISRKTALAGDCETVVGTQSVVEWTLASESLPPTSRTP